MGFYFLSVLLVPFVKVLTSHRLKKGLEEKDRIRERYGIASVKRPRDPLIWIHAASVGETISLIPLIKSYKENYPGHSILLTTTTVTAASIAKQRLSDFCIHQYVPFDVGPWVKRFLKYWKPQLAVLVESELWPNMITQIHKMKIPLVLLNARLSDRSYRRWLKFKCLAKQLLSRFSLCLAQSPSTAERLIHLGASNVEVMSNLKFAADPLPTSLDKLQELSGLFKDRPVWVAASTHSSEEEIVIQTHHDLKKQFPNLLTILIPRHPNRCEKVKKLCEDSGLSVQSHSTLPAKSSSNFDVYLVDTIGELGLFFSLSSIVFIGGSFVSVEGHNPIEPALFKCAILWGPRMSNFKDVCAHLSDDCYTVLTQKELTEGVQNLLLNPKKVKALGAAAFATVKEQAEGAQKIVHRLRSFYDR
ncbi:MAG: 3-deoxy-D-manno-octulosonic acid transferase [Alphaproteobacteria bacterium]|nr:3-deoxy-D-manno-octulosonic acid transferase [Alphaproteobacteria bacterium]